MRTKKRRRRKFTVELRVPPPTPTKLNEVWAMDFMHDQLENGRAIRTLNLIDKLSREALAVDVDYASRAPHVIEALERVCADRGEPAIISMDNGSEFTSKALESRAYYNGVKLHFIRLGKPTKNGHIESFIAVFAMSA